MDLDHFSPFQSLFLEHHPEQTFFFSLRIKIFVVGNCGLFLGGQEAVGPVACWGTGSQPADFIFLLFYYMKNTSYSCTVF